MKDGACVCPRTDKKVKLEANSFRCVKTVADDPRKPGRDNGSGAKLKGEAKDSANSTKLGKPAKPRGSPALRSSTSSRLLLAPR